MRYFKMCKSSFACLLLALLAPIAASAGVGSGLIWPGLAPCNTTLQACINAATAGDRIEIVQTALIDENITISKSLSLVGTTGLNGTNGASIYYGQFSPGRRVSANSFPASGAQSLSIEGLVFNNGGVDVNYSQNGSLNVQIRNLLIKNPTTTNDFGIRLHQNAGSGTVAAVVQGNTLELGNPGLFAVGITVGSAVAGASFTANVYENKLTALTTLEGFGIFAGVSNGATATAKIWSNELRGEFQRAGIGAVEGMFSSTPSTLTAHIVSNVLIGKKGFSQGIGLIQGNGNISAQVLNNSVTNQNNGISASRWNATAGGGITASLGNNLVAYNINRGIQQNPEYATSITNRNNLVWANGGNQFPAHATTITLDPLLIHKEHPWVSSGSPAIDAGDGTLTALNSIFTAIPYLAADGLRRDKGVRIDIGAYEFGDVSFRHTTTTPNTPSHTNSIDHPAVNANSNVKMHATQQFSGGASPNNSYGLYREPGQWRLFNQVTSTPILAGVPFALFAPDSSLGSFVHAAKTTPTNNIVGWSTLIDNSATNDQPDEIVFVTQHWNAPGAGTTYNPHPIGIFYLSLGSGKWFVTNLDQVPGQDMPHNAGFNIYAQAPSKNAFRLTANNRTRFGASAVFIDHPLLNGNPCATPQVTRLLAATPLTGNFDLYYAPTAKRWAIGQFTNPLADGQQFHVLIDARQVQECAGVMFEDGFE